MQTWVTDVGTVCVLWSDPRVIGLPPLDRVAAQLSHADALVCVQSEFRSFGPGLSIAQPGNLTQWKRFGARWADLARILGQPAPYWPLMLRIPTGIDGWKPGAPTSTYLTIPEIDTTPLLRLAAILRQGSPAQHVLLHLARITQLRSTNGALHELQPLADGDITVVAARCQFPKSTARLSTKLRAILNGWNSPTAPMSWLRNACI
ncbi:MAG: hypothetical protein ACRDRE_13485 [Pseudonocardiaceae bacterium]